MAGVRAVSTHRLTHERRCGRSLPLLMLWDGCGLREAISLILRWGMPCMPCKVLYAGIYPNPSFGPFPPVRWFCGVQKRCTFDYMHFIGIYPKRGIQRVFWSLLRDSAHVVYTQLVCSHVTPLCFFTPSACLQVDIGLWQSTHFTVWPLGGGWKAANRLQNKHGHVQDQTQT